MSYSIATTSVTASPQVSSPSGALGSIVVAPSTNAAATTEFIPEPLPTKPLATKLLPTKPIPGVIEPPGGVPAQPSNTIIVQVGFLEPLQYVFVVNSKVTQDQLFDFIPPGLSYVTIVEGEEVIMHSLRAYTNTAEVYPYIPTVAFRYMPTRSIDILKSAIQAPDSPLYNNPDDSTRKIMSYINPGIPVDVEAGSSRTSGPPPFPIDAEAGSFPTPGPSPLGLSSGAKIGIAIGIPIFIIALLVLGSHFWRRRKAARRSQAAATGENESRTQMPADEKAGELPVEYSHELSAEERQELSADSWRRELHGPDFAQKLEAHGNNDRQ